MTKRPNFLFFITDQQRADHLSCYGNKLLKTPNVDAIAKAGTRFDRFYVATPICMPNRCTIMTGRMPSVHGVRHNGIPLSLDATTFVEVLRAAGYRTALVGKSHLQNFTGEVPKFQPKRPPGRQPPPKELSDAVRPLRDGPLYDRELHVDPIGQPGTTPTFYGFDHLRICTWHGDEVQGHYTDWLNAHWPNAAELRKPANAIPDPRYNAPQVRRTRIPEDLYPTNYVAEETVAYLRQHAAEGGDEPFFIQCSFPDPHHPFTPPGKYFDMYDPADVELPPSFYHPTHDQTPFLKGIHAEFATGKQDRTWVRPYAVNESEAKQITAVTYGMIAAIDDAVGKVMATLKELNLDEDTVIVFTADHGDWMGDHGLMQKGILHYNGMIRVPFIWRDPDGQMAGQACGALTGSLDIARSILDRAGLAPFHGIQGQNLNDIRAGTSNGAFDGIVIEQQSARPFPGFEEPVKVRTYVTDEWRLTYWSQQSWGELYNLKNDPYEMVNLWADPNAANVRAELTERMLRRFIDLQEQAPFPVGEA